MYERSKRARSRGRIAAHVPLEIKAAHELQSRSVGIPSTDAPDVAAAQVAIEEQPRPKGTTFADRVIGEVHCCYSLVAVPSNISKRCKVVKTCRRVVARMDTWYRNHR